MPEEPTVDAPHVEYVLALRQGPHELPCSEILEADWAAAAISFLITVARSTEPRLWDPINQIP